MGCSSSTSKVYSTTVATATSNSDSKRVANHAHVHPLKKAASYSKFIGAAIGAKLLHRIKINDHIYKWEYVEVINIVGDRILLHFNSTAASVTLPDLYLNIKETVEDGDMTHLSICPFELLTVDQIQLGLPLDQHQADKAWYYLRMGTFLVDPNAATVPLLITRSNSNIDRKPVEMPSLADIKRRSNRNLSNNSDVPTTYTAITSSKSSSNIPNQVAHADSSSGSNCMDDGNHIRKYTAGERIDIQDSFEGSDNNRWRKGRITSVQGSKLRVHYIGLDDGWDDVIDIDTQPYRIAESGTMTSLQLSSTRKGSVLKNNQTPLLTSDSAATATTPLYNRRLSHEGKSISLSVSTLMAEQKSQIDKKTKSSADVNSSFYSTTSIDSSNSSCIDDRISLSSPQSNYSNRRDSHRPSLTPMLRHERRRSFPAPDTLRSTEERYLDLMEQIGLHVIDIVGDGNCLFRAISHQLHLSQDHHEELRSKCVQHMQQHRNRYEPFCSIGFDEHIKQMAMPASWGDDLEIKALEEILDRHVLVYSSESKGDRLHPININMEESIFLMGVAPIVLSYHGYSHYNSVFDQKQPLPLKARDPSSNVLLTRRIQLFNETYK